MKLPPDPEGMNDDRAEWAEHAIDAFGERTRMNTAGEDRETMLGDLLTNLMHWCDRNDVDWDMKLLGATVNYDGETSGDDDDDDDGEGDDDDHSADCADGIHSWVNETGKLPADTPCKYCGELYGHPD